MNIEFEAKFLDIDIVKLRPLLASLGAKRVLPERKMRRVQFDKINNEGLKVNFIRVRDEGGKIRMSAKVLPGEGGGVADQKETDVLVDDFDDTIEILELSGLSRTNYQENLRETWKLGDSLIEIDTWPGLKPFIEIESSSESEVMKAADLLNVSWTDKLASSVEDVYMLRYSLSRSEVKHLLVMATFEDNPFENL